MSKVASYGRLAIVNSLPQGVRPIVGRGIVASIILKIMLNHMHHDLSNKRLVSSVRCPAVLLRCICVVKFLESFSDFSLIVLFPLPFTAFPVEIDGK